MAVRTFSLAPIPERKAAPSYLVSRAARGWVVSRLDEPCRIGEHGTRKAAIQCARLLAGWRGTVTVEK